MTELMPCAECKMMFEAKDHFCFACYGKICQQYADEREKNELLTAQVLGLNQTIKRLLKANSELVQTTLPLDFGSSTKRDI